MTDDQSNYICNDDDLNSLTDYFTAVLAGEESKSRLQQMWEQEIGIIKAMRTETATVPQQGQEYFLITKEELDQIKNDCAFPETPNCDGCEYAGDFDPVRASGVGCVFKGANALMDEIIKRSLLKEHDSVIQKDERKRLLQLIKEWQRKHCYWFRLPHTGGEQRYHFDPMAFKEFLDSLVATDPVPGSKKEGEQKHD